MSKAIKGEVTFFRASLTSEGHVFYTCPFLRATVKIVTFCFWISIAWIERKSENDADALKKISIKV